MMSEWIEWEGGECPVNKDTRVDVRLRDGDILSACLAGMLLWNLGEDSRAIADYRISKKQQFGKKETILEEAGRIVSGKRQSEYGVPERNYDKIAALWSAYLGATVTATDVCQLMILLKQARLKESPNHRDSLVDIAGYAALIEIINEG